MGFAMELIPLLRAAGYRYVIVDSAHVVPMNPEEMNWATLRYRPHRACFAGEALIVIVRDRELSNAQESGLEPEWFCKEVAARTQGCKGPPLVTTCTDGENGGWFRNTQSKANFWGAFYQPLLEQARNDDRHIRAIFISEYLERFGVEGEVRVDTGAWNTGWHHGRDFTQWTGSRRQRQAIERIHALSDQVHRRHPGLVNPALLAMWEHALWHLLRAQTSCNFYWGEAWVERAEADLDAVAGTLADL
jgi:alpha-amylase/alpha-mannosidase (GH57 family)